MRSESHKIGRTLAKQIPSSGWRGIRGERSILAADEIVAAVVLDGDIEKFPDFGIDGDENSSIDVRRVPHGSGNTFFLDKDALGLSELTFVDVLGDLVDGGCEFVVTLFAGGVMDLAGHLVSAGSFFLGVLENAAAFKFEGLDEFQEFLVIFLCFAGEAGDEGGADGQVGNAITHSLEKVPDVLSVSLPVHLFEHVIGNMLKRDIDVAGDFGALCDGLNKLIGPMGRVGVEEADPEVTFEFVERTEEGGEGFAFSRVDTRGRVGAVAEALPLVHAEVGRVLGDEVDFLHALGNQAPGFADDGVLGAGAVLAPDFWDDAEGTGVITAFGDLDVGHVIRGEPESGRGVVGNVT